MIIKSFAEDTSPGFQAWQGTEWISTSAQPFQSWMLSKSYSHLWRADLPKQLPIGAHILESTTVDRYNRLFSETIVFEVVEELPNLNWQQDF